MTEKLQEQASHLGSATADIAALANKEWQTYLEPLLTLGGRLVSQTAESHDPQIRRELYRGIFSQMSTGFLASLFADSQHPDWWPYVSPAFTFAGGNPDNDYYTTPIDDTGVYRIVGYRGTVKRVDIQIGTGTFFPRGVLDEQLLGRTLANYDFDSLDLAADGSVEVILSQERPKGYDGNWWKLYPKTSYLLLRQISYDWANEIDGRFAIERLDRPAEKPRSSTAALEENLRQIAKWTEGTVQLSLAFANGIRRDQGINKMAYKDLTEYGELITQKYAYGGFDLAPDEALIVEARVPEKCRYWSIHLLDAQGFALDWVNRQTGLNGFTATLDGDGVFRGVISAQDPGIANWLDTMGYALGTIQARWEECSSWPDHKVTKIKVEEVRAWLPSGTPTVTPEQRQAMLRLRRKGAQMRKRW
jgi:hypothetical protein